MHKTVNVVFVGGDPSIWSLYHSLNININKFVNILLDILKLVETNFGL